MTNRQELLKQEIIELSELLQLGIRNTDKDWFYEFVKKMDESGKWHKLNDIRISKDCYEEFKNKNLDAFKQYLLDSPWATIKYIAPYLLKQENYLCFWGYYAAIKAAKDTNITDRLAESLITVWDQTYNRLGSNGVPTSPIETAWHFLFENPSITEAFKSKYHNKPLRNTHYSDGKRIEKNWFEKLMNL